jgi:hypothetical protein
MCGGCPAGGFCGVFELWHERWNNVEPTPRKTSFVVLKEGNVNVDLYLEVIPDAAYPGVILWAERGEHKHALAMIDSDGIHTIPNVPEEFGFNTNQNGELEVESDN